MAEENIRQNKTGVTAEEKDRCIKALKSNGAFVFKSFLPTTENCHFERYSFLCGKEKLGVVYDTKARLFTCTGKPDVLARVPFLSDTVAKGGEAAAQKQPAQPVKQQQQVKQQKSAAKDTHRAKGNAQDRQVVPKTQTPPPDMPLSKPADKTTREPKLRPLLLVPEQEKLPQVRKNREKLPQVQYAREKLPQVKKEKPAKTEKPVKAIKPEKTEKHKKAKTKAQPEPPVLDKKTERALKKLLPVSYALLGAQSKKDLAAGMVDLGNAQVRLSDYSVLLVPPYRALERFIYDLQQARGISVKMIGQAYEKNAEGKHVLKQCYRRKAGVVYSEVMSALYGEYFANRNFYAHSDNTETNAGRTIPDKPSAKAVFDTLCEIIEYNGKKLTEIGFCGSKADRATESL